MNKKTEYTFQNMEWNPIHFLVEAINTVHTMHNINPLYFLHEDTHANFCSLFCLIVLFVSTKTAGDSIDIFGKVTCHPAGRIYGNEYKLDGYPNMSSKKESDVLLPLSLSILKWVQWHIIITKIKIQTHILLRWEKEAKSPTVIKCCLLFVQHFPL